MQHLSYLRRARVRWTLSQRDLAQLLGTTQSVVSRIESGEAVPDTLTAFRLQVVFGTSPRALFPAAYHTIEDAVMRNAARFERSLAGRIGYQADTKRRLLAAMMHRARPNQHGA